MGTTPSVPEGDDIHLSPAANGEAGSVNPVKSKEMEHSGRRGGKRSSRGMTSRGSASVASVDGNSSYGGESRRDSRQFSNGAMSPLHTHSRSLSPIGAISPGSARGGSRAVSPSGRRSVADDSVTFELPMADLMAYLQVVANNSSNLPLTRRDDPELGRTVSSLTAEEYATKCSAFVPADVRIIGGQYTKYGRVWDLPTSQDFDLSGVTREPGLSHGGACLNAMLKAMYDTESEANNLAQGHVMDHKNLFDDDDDETVDTAGYTVDRTITSFDTLVLNDANNNSSMSWADLLRKMKKEMQGVGFPQAPAITSSTKFDLNQPFSLVPRNFKPGVNKKRALLIGCNYRKTPDSELKACHDDVRSIKDFLVNVYGFPETDDLMKVLMDEKDYQQPTHQNITEAFKQLAEKSQPGDAVFVLYTGHGCRVLDSPLDSESESYDEALIPCDYLDTGIIRDTLVFKTLFAPMRKGVTVTCIIDCCHTGLMIDLPYLWTTKGDKDLPLAKMSINNDFSFVRFLKVVKTLYESSVFTRIGKTVGSELDKHVPTRDDETVGETVGSLVTLPEHEPVTRERSSGTLFQMLTCQSPKDIASKVINCTLHAPEEFSDDEETLQRNNTADENDDDATLDTYGTGGSSHQ